MLLTIAVVNLIYIKMKYSISFAQNSTLVAIFLIEKGPPALQTPLSLVILSLSSLNENKKKRNCCLIGNKPPKNLSNISDSSFHFTQLVSDEKNQVKNNRLVLL